MTAVFYFQTAFAMNPPASRTLPVYRADAAGIRADEDVLAEETPVALVYNGISHAVLMATPADLEALALGFSLSEGILEKASELYAVETETVCNGIEVRMDIAAARFHVLKERRRSMSGRTGCGLCGIDSLAAVKPAVRRIPRGGSIRFADVQTALSGFDAHQPLRSQTGSVHGAAWVAGGRIVCAFEDVGRHNALDKLIGHGVKNGFDFTQGFALVSSRASYEMVMKAAAAGIGCLTAVSAPTALAVRLAEEAGMTLIGFAKPQKFTVYSGQEYVEAV